MKKIIVLMLFAFIFVNIVCMANGTVNDYKSAFMLLKNYDIIEERFITRRDCLVYIMKIIGVTDQTKLNVIPEKTFVDCHGTDMVYYDYAIFYGIANGTKFNGDYSYSWSFEPNRCATYNEALTFILRCLKDKPMDIKKEAVDLGILNETDSFYNNLDEYMTDNEFYVLLKRMLEQKCYIYVGEMRGSVEAKTYLEKLEEQQRNGATFEGQDHKVWFYRDGGGKKVFGDLYEMYK